MIQCISYNAKRHSLENQRDRAGNIPLCSLKRKSASERGMAELRDITYVLINAEKGIKPTRKRAQV